MNETEAKKKTIYSAIQPTGVQTLGNYLGAVSNWLPMQEENNCIFAIADLHSLTVRQDAAELRRRSMSLLAQFLAFGLDEQKSAIYFQSSVHEHAELAWILNCYTYIGELERMTQFKDKSAKHQDNINAGLLTYPVLMAADILLYGSDEVPIGADQKQHLEIARDIAIRFNNLYGDVFTIPEPYMGRAGARIRSLQNPLVKMSKSDTNENGFISVLDAPDVIVKKMKRAVTDSEAHVAYDEARPGICNLMTILSVITGESFDSITARYEGRGYGDFKAEVADAVVGLLRPVQERYAYFMDNRDFLTQVAVNGRERAEAIARRTMRKVYKKVGLVGLN